MTDWDQRQLCADGACTGVIGPDGTCKVCGRAAQNWGDERKRGMVAEAEAEPDEPAQREERAPATEAREPDPEWDKRSLCPDGACVGVIGSDGKCKVCGRSAA